MHTRLDLYQSVTPLAGLGIWERDLKTGEMYWNKIVRDILEVDDNFSPSIKETICFYKYPLLIENLILRVTKSGLPELITTEIISRSGKVKWVKIRMQSNFEGTVCNRIYGTMEDVTTHVSLLNELQERESKFESAFDFAPIGMAIISIEGKWLKVNNELCRILGYNEHAFINTKFDLISHPDDLKQEEKLMNELLDGNVQSYEMEKRYFHANGNFIWALLKVSLVRDNNDVPLYFISQIKDISERKKNLEIISNQNKRLLNFAHIVSHNLRSHTGNIRMLSDMAINSNQESERLEYINMLGSSSSKLLETLDHLNEIIKINDQVLSNRITLNLHKEVLRVLEILSASIIASSADIIIDINKNISILYDPAYLESIFLNLITNSIKYKKQDTRLKIIIKGERKEKYILISVEDNGIGIDLEAHGSRLFEMYTTFHTHPDARGLGLFLVKNQVESLGGEIYAESQIGKGTKFFVSLLTQSQLY